MKLKILVPLIFSILMTSAFSLAIGVEDTQRSIGQSEDPNRNMDEITSSDGYFLENMGQVDNEEILFYSMDCGMSYGLRKDGISVLLFDGKEGWMFNTTFVNSLPSQPIGTFKTGGKTNFIFGSDCDQITGLENFKKIIYHGIYPSIDLVVYTSDSSLKYDFIVHPSGNPENIRIKTEGASMNIDKGDLFYHTPLGSVIEDSPYSYQYPDVGIASGWIIHSDGSAGFEIGEYDDSKDLIIDPELKASTYLGGSIYDVGEDIKMDSSGNPVLCGYTYSTNFPTTTGSYDTSHNNYYDVFVTKMDPVLGSIKFSTFIGGSSNDYGSQIGFINDDIIVTGYTWSNNFPTTSGAYDRTYNSYTDCFVLKLDGDGDSIFWSTYVGGSRYDNPMGASVDDDGYVYITGETYSSDYPTTTGAYDTSLNGDYDIFATKLDKDGSGLIYSTYIGGSYRDSGQDIALADNGDAFLVGYSRSYDFPTTTSAYDTSINGNYDAVIIRLSSTGKVLSYSTYFGGSSTDYGYGLILDDKENVYITGTCGDTIPTTSGAYDISHNGNYDVFVSIFNKSLEKLERSTYIGGSSNDYGYDIQMDFLGNLHVTGQTYYSYYPTTSDAYRTTGSYTEIFYSSLDKDLAKLSYSTLIGGNDDEIGYSLCISTSGKVYLTGSTESNDFTTVASAYDTSYNGNTDTFATSFSIIDSDPKDLSATTGYLYVNLSWELPDLSEYGISISKLIIYRGITAQSLQPVAVIAPTTWYNDTIRSYKEISYRYKIGVILEGIGYSGESTVITASPIIPGELDILNVENGDMKVNITWNNLQSDVLEMYDVSHYSIYRGRYEDALIKIASVSGRRWYLDEDFEDGISMYFYAVTYTLEGIGEGNPSDSATAQPNTPPSIPSDLSYERLDGSISLTWNIPRDNGGYKIEGYQIFRGNCTSDLSIHSELDSSSYSYLDNSAVPGSTYFYSIRAHNKLGYGMMTEPISITAITVPSAPVYFLASPSDSLIDLYWAPPSETWGVDILSYNIYRGASPSNMDLYNVVPGYETHMADTIDNNITFFYSIGAVNLLGEGDRLGPLSSSGCTTPSGVQDFSIKTAENEVLLLWNKDVFDGGTPIQSFNIYRGEGNLTPEKKSILPAEQGWYFDRDIETGRNYTYMISASNAMGEGPLSEPITAAPSSRPGTIDVFTVKPRLYSAYIEWEKPVDPDVKIISYKLYRGFSPHSLELLVNISANNRRIINYIDKNLVYDNTYYYAVSSLNEMGETGFSMILSVIPYGEPDKPVLRSYETGKDSILVKWSEPSSLGALEIEQYLLSFRIKDGKKWNVINTTSTEYTIDGLSPGMYYDIGISCENFFAEGPPLELEPILVGIAPEKPLSLSYTTDNGPIRITWSEADGNGCDILGYRIYHIDGDDRHINIGEVEGNTRSFELGLLSPSESYDIAVSALNTIGEGPCSNILKVKPMTLPGSIDSASVVEVGNGVVHLEWTPPVYDGGSDIEGYNIYKSTTPGVEVLVQKLVDVTHFTDEDVVNGMTYYYLISAYNSVGEGHKSDRLMAIPAWTPAKPGSLEITAGTDTVTVRWTKPVEENGYRILGYLIYRGSSPDDMVFLKSVGPETMMIDDKDVSPGTIYYKVVAYNEMGVGEATIDYVNVPSRVGLGIAAGIFSVLIPLSAAGIFIAIYAIGKKKRKKEKIKPEMTPELKLTPTPIPTIQKSEMSLPPGGLNAQIPPMADMNRRMLPPHPQGPVGGSTQYYAAPPISTQSPIDQGQVPYPAYQYDDMRYHKPVYQNGNYPRGGA